MKTLIRPLQLSILALILGVISPVHAESPNLDFELINKTGYDIKEVYIAPSASDNWEEDILKEPLSNGETLAVSFAPGETSKKWDLKIVWVDGGDAVYWKGYDLSEISKITLMYNDNTDVTSAKTE